MRQRPGRDAAPAPGRRARAALAALLAAGHWGCATAPPPPPGYLVVGVETAPATLDPRDAVDAASAQVVDLVFRGLTAPAHDGGFAPDLAAGWQRDGLDWRFTLRPARFHDGSPVRAEDVVATYRSLAFGSRRGLRAAEIDPIVSVEAIDERTVLFRLRAPFAPFLAATTIGIVPAACAAEPECRTGSGPFRIVARDVDSVTLAAVADGPATPRLPGIVFRASPDGASRALGLARGSIDLVQNAVEPELLPWLAERGLVVDATPGSTFQYLGMNLREPALADPRVRQAIAAAIDVPAIVAHVLAGRARPAGELLPPGHWAHAGIPAIRHDPERARALLAEAGVHGLRLEYKTSTVDLRRRVAEAIGGFLGRVGIEVAIRPLEWAALYGDVRRGNVELFSLAWVGVQDPDLLHGWLHSARTPPLGNNRAGYANPAVDRLTEAAQAEDDPARRRALYLEVAREVRADVPFVPLWWSDNVAVHSPRLEGFAPTPSGDLRGLAGAGWRDGVPPRREG